MHSHRRFRPLAAALAALPLSIAFAQAPAMTADTQVLNRLDATAAEPQVPTLSTAAMLSYDAEANAALRHLVLEAPADPTSLAGKRIAILSTDGVEEVEITVPRQYFIDRGATVHVVAPKIAPMPSLGLRLPSLRDTHLLTVRYMENGTWLRFDRTLDAVQATDYDAVFVPGGAWNPDNLRMMPAALDFLRAAEREGVLVAAICHGPQVLISADLLRVRNATGYWSIHVDLRNAGAEVTDVPVVRDGSLITARFPLDLPPMLVAMHDALVSR